MADPQAAADPHVRSAVGARITRTRARALSAGRGRYTDDITLPQMAHVAFLRSPFPHARIVAINIDRSSGSRGVIASFTSTDIARVCRPMRTQLDHVPQHISAEQSPLASGEVVWQGEPVAAVVAKTRAEAEDAVAAIDVEWEPLPAVGDAHNALAPETPPAHTALANNLGYAAHVEGGDVTSAFAKAANVVRHTFNFGRLNAVSLEPRTIVADFNPGDETLTVYQSHQSPHLMQQLFAHHLELAEHKVRVIAPDVGGAFGMKLHVYGDEMAVAAMSRILGRPLKYACDRWEAFQSDAQAREFYADATIATDERGHILGLKADLICGLGAFSLYPRGSLGEGMQAATFIGAPYDIDSFQVDIRFAYQNKVPTGALRGVGQPIACVITEQMIDLAAEALGLDPLEMRRRNYLRHEQLPKTTLGGIKLRELSLSQCLNRLAVRMDYEGLRRDQAEMRRQKVYRGIGIATFVEQTAVGAGLYGPSGLPITAQDTCILRAEPSGVIRCEVGCTDQGQGTLTGIAQIVADAFGVPVEDVAVNAGDSAGAQGGGAWSSRGLTIGGEAAFLAAKDLRHNVLSLAASILQSSEDRLDIRNREIVDASDGAVRMTVSELCRSAHFRQDLLPPNVIPELTVVRHFVPREFPYLMSNGIQASYLEVDCDTGWIRLLDHWVVEDCGKIINPLLADEQIRGGVAQGLGAALFEHCVYGFDGQLQTTTLADYLVPMASELPDIVVDHIETPHTLTSLGTKGIGEAGTVGASGAVWCAINDALRPFGKRVSHQPFTPAVILRALEKVR
ncbi:MAG TPA: xanthine dehydrogenase family protein molybdopterin-binding subunit [Xanthobacteraceae bacterium]|nr:xanthine dehydrogenase family protein molybdopterin-binding subunit [Xanthobacteraceae bacterium]